VVFVFPIAIGPNAEVLRNLLPAILWVSALLALVLTLPEVFAADYADGSLELLILSPHPLPLLVLAKAFAQWITGVLPLIAMSALLGGVLGLDFNTWVAVELGLLLGTPTLSLIAAIGTALTVGLPRSGVLLAVLVLPLSIPVLVFGAGVVDTALNGLPLAGVVALLAALLVLAVSFAPLAIAAALRISVQ
jgi:heme exporter protein B